MVGLGAANRNTPESVKLAVEVEWEPKTRQPFIQLNDNVGAPSNGSGSLPFCLPELMMFSAG